MGSGQRGRLAIEFRYSTSRPRLPFPEAGRTAAASSRGAGTARAQRPRPGRARNTGVTGGLDGCGAARAPRRLSPERQPCTTSDQNARDGSRSNRDADATPTRTGVAQQKTRVTRLERSLWCDARRRATARAARTFVMSEWPVPTCFAWMWSQLRLMLNRSAACATRESGHAVRGTARWAMWRGAPSLTILANWMPKTDAIQKLTETVGDLRWETPSRASSAPVTRRIARASRDVGVGALLVGRRGGRDPG